MRLKIKILGTRTREKEAERRQETVVRHANVRRRGSERKRMETETNHTEASIDSGRRSNDLRQTARVVERGEGLPWVKSTYRLRSCAA